VAFKDIAEALGLGTPFYFAAATYYFFNWLDRNASTQATQAISGWVRGQPYKRIDMRLAITAAFDRLYTSPLFRVKAFLRSATLSSIVWLAFLAIWAPVHLQLVRSGTPIPILITNYSTTLGSVILSDYISLFVVWRCLIIAAGHPIGAILLAGAIGSVVIIIIFILLGASLLVEDLFLINLVRPSAPRLTLGILVGYTIKIGGVFGTVFPALVVHFWLPLFAIGALGVRFLYPIFRAIEWAQWFLKQGNQHPLRAIGVVAAVLVFAGTAIGKAFAVIA
jgi:hypothetical protein